MIKITSEEADLVMDFVEEMMAPYAIQCESYHPDQWMICKDGHHYHNVPLKTRTIATTITKFVAKAIQQELDKKEGGDG